MISALCLTVSVMLHSEPRPDEAQDPIAAALKTWHRGERVSGFGPFLGAGLATAVSGSLLVTSPSELARSAGWPLLGFGALEVLAGLFFGFSSFPREAERLATLEHDRSDFLLSERARIGRITSTIQPILLTVEAVVAVGGGGLAGAGALTRNDLLLGLGLGFAVQGLVLFLLDWAVLDRAQAYATALAF